MSAKVNLNIDNTINFTFSAADAEKAILKVLNDKNLAGVYRKFCFVLPKKSPAFS